MLTREHLKRLKQVNVSVSAEKTKDRIKFDFANSTNKEKREIVELSGQKRASFYRAYETGAVNARLVLAIAQVLNISPYYYTGEDDERQRLAEETTFQFLKEKGYGDLAEEIKNETAAATKRGKKPKTEDLRESFQEGYDDHETCEDECSHETDDDFDEDEIQFELTFADTKKMRNAIESMSEDDMVLLLRALIRRSEVGGEAEEIMEVVKRCLIS